MNHFNYRYFHSVFIYSNSFELTVWDNDRCLIDFCFCRRLLLLFFVAYTQNTLVPGTISTQYVLVHERKDEKSKDEARVAVRTYILVDRRYSTLLYVYYYVYYSSPLKLCVACVVVCRVSCVCRVSGTYL